MQVKASVIDLQPYLTNLQQAKSTPEMFNVLNRLWTFLNNTLQRVDPTELIKICDYFDGNKHRFSYSEVVNGFQM